MVRCAVEVARAAVNVPQFVVDRRKLADGIWRRHVQGVTVPTKSVIEMPHEFRCGLRVARLSESLVSVAAQLAQAFRAAHAVPFGS
jgi:hypothetical protein